MAYIIPTQDWFLDIIIQLLGAIASLALSYYGYKSYKLTKERPDLYFSLAFLFLSTNLILYALIVPLIFIYYTFYRHIDPGIFLPVSHALNFIFMFLILNAYTLLICVYTKLEKKSVLALWAIFLFVITLYSFIFKYFLVFNLMVALLVLFISFYTLKNYLTKKTKNSMLVALSFILLTIAHISLALATYISILSIVGHVLQFIAYTFLLSMLLRVYYGRT